MQENKLSAQVRQEGTVSIIDLEGDINRSSDEIFQAAYEETAAEGATQIVLNFSKVGFINSTGIAVIVSFLARARAAKQDLVVFGLTEHYQRIFEITRLVDFMSVLPDETSALRHTSDQEN